LGGGYWLYAQNKTAIHEYFTKLMEKRASTSPTESDFDLDKVEFSAGSYELNAPARTQLNKLASYLRKNTNVQGEIACHTDNSGNPALNLQISEARAKIVYDYLIQKGVNSTQITYKGYGDLHPLVPNVSEANRQKNRRVGFVMRKR
jgi:outer membrane protein OmpA-like peptidoglycan-associated protein